jgi:hypothetical protein
MEFAEPLTGPDHVRFPVDDPPTTIEPVAVAQTEGLDEDVNDITGLEFTVNIFVLDEVTVPHEFVIMHR